MRLNTAAENAAFSSLVLVPSVIRMSSQNPARPLSASEWPPQNQSAGSAASASTAVTFGSLCKKLAASSLPVRAMAALRPASDRLVAYLIVIIGMTVSLVPVGDENLTSAPSLRNVMIDDISNNNAK